MNIEGERWRLFWLLPCARFVHSEKCTYSSFILNRGWRGLQFIQLIRGTKCFLPRRPCYTRMSSSMLPFVLFRPLLSTRWPRCIQWRIFVSCARRTRVLKHCLTTQDSMYGSQIPRAWRWVGGVTYEWYETIFDCSLYDGLSQWYLLDIHVESNSVYQRKTPRMRPRETKAVIISSVRVISSSVWLGFQEFHQNHFTDRRLQT